MDGACRAHGSSAFKLLVLKADGKRTLGIPKRRWDDNIKTNLIEIACDDVNWIHMVQGRDQWQFLVNTIVNFRGFS
jgi:hypothetical protein